MSYVDPVTGHIWHNNVHLEIRRKYVSPEAAQTIKDIMEGKPYKMKAEDIGPQELRRIAEAIILDHAHDIEWFSITEMASDMLEASYYSLDHEEEEKVWHMIDAWIKKAKITIEFEDCDAS